MVVVCKYCACAFVFLRSCLPEIREGKEGTAEVWNVYLYSRTSRRLR